MDDALLNIGNNNKKARQNKMTTTVDIAEPDK